MMNVPTIMNAEQVAAMSSDAELAKSEETLRTTIAKTKDALVNIEALYAAIVAEQRNRWLGKGE